MIEYSVPLARLVVVVFFFLRRLVLMRKPGVEVAALVHLCIIWLRMAIATSRTDSLRCVRHISLRLNLIINHKLKIVVYIRKKIRIHSRIKLVFYISK